MAYQVAQLTVTLSEAEGHLCCLNFCNAHNSGNMACFIYSVFTRKL